MNTSKILVKYELRGVPKWLLLHAFCSNLMFTAISFYYIPYIGSY